MASSLTGPIGNTRAAQPGRGGKGGGVQIFSARGISTAYTMGSFPLSQIGFLIPGTGRVYVRPRITQTEGFSGGGGSQGATKSGSVVITNPGYANYNRFQRSRSVGMAGAGQTGRVMDVPFAKDIGHFSIA